VRLASPRAAVALAQALGVAVPAAVDR